jgi:hypothetical protein
MSLNAREARQLDEIATRLATADPQLARRLVRHQTWHHSLAELGFGVLLLAGSGSGVVVLGVGLHDAVTWLIAVGVVACVVLPTAAPLLLTAALRARRRCAA